MTTNVRCPYQLDARGHTAAADEDTWIRGLIEQVLFTAPGERVMRPDFGCGIAQLVFAPNSPELAATTQFLVQGALQQWLSNLITVEAVDVVAEDSTLRVTVRYVVRRSQKRQLAEFSREGVSL
jgi:phage baseplate assembly protein W